MCCQPTIMCSLLTAGAAYMANVHESSYVGGELDLFALAKNWKSYIKDETSSYTTGDVLEVGAGIGATTVALHDGTAGRWTCLEPDHTLARRLKARLRSEFTTATVNVVVGSLRTFADRPCVDCILYIDVLEHIEDDRAQIEAAARLVRPSGHIVILAPAHRWLFSEFDKSIGHLRRYHRAGLRSLMPRGWTEEKLIYMDSIGVLLSLGNVVGLRQSVPTESQIILWNRVCVPVSRFIDRLFCGAVGKSVLAVWRKE
jgi:SAM-dependent methyltransferase